MLNFKKQTMESIKKILADLKEFQQWDATWQETRHKLLDREKELATKYAEYCRGMIDKPMPYEEWYNTTQLEE